MVTNEYKGYTIYKQQDGSFYICGLKYVTETMEKAVKEIDNYLSNNEKARQEALIKEARSRLSA